jgi:hypothetical protein
MTFYDQPINNNNPYKEEEDEKKHMRVNSVREV